MVIFSSKIYTEANIPRNKRSAEIFQSMSEAGTWAPGQTAKHVLNYNLLQEMFLTSLKL